MHFALCTNASFLLVETVCIFTAQLTFPLLGVMFRHTLRALTVPGSTFQCLPFVYWLVVTFPCGIVNIQVESRVWWAAGGSSPTLVPESPDKCPR